MLSLFFQLTDGNFTVLIHSLAAKEPNPLRIWLRPNRRTPNILALFVLKNLLLHFRICILFIAEKFIIIFFYFYSWGNRAHKQLHVRSGWRKLLSAMAWHTTAQLCSPERKSNKFTMIISLIKCSRSSTEGTSYRETIGVYTSPAVMSHRLWPALSPWSWTFTSIIRSYMPAQTTELWEQRYKEQ